MENTNPTIGIIDETLRDGEQQAFINFSSKQKIELAKSIFKLGVDFITLMPVINKEDLETAKEISTLGKVICLTPCNEESIETSLQVSKYILLFQGVSDFLMKHRHKTDDLSIARVKNTQNIIKCLKKAQSLGAEIHFGLEDASRADAAYLNEIMEAVNPYISAVCIPDSVGIMKPEEITELISFIKTKTIHPIVIHTHNDLGLADQNAVAGVEAGATYISGTFTGIGERAGNMNLGNVIRLLVSKGYTFNINMDEIIPLEKNVEGAAKKQPAKPYSDEAFFHESGIHAHALLSGNLMAYNGVNPELLGKKHHVIFGKKSGISNFKFYLGDKFSDEIYRDFLNIIKKKSIEENRSFTFDEVRKFLGI